MYYTVCCFTGIFYAIVRHISMLFIDNKDSVFYILYPLSQQCVVCLGLWKVLSKEERPEPDPEPRQSGYTPPRLADRFIEGFPHHEGVNQKTAWNKHCIHTYRRYNAEIYSYSWKMGPFAEKLLRTRELYSKEKHGASPTYSSNDGSLKSGSPLRREWILSRQFQS